MRTVEGKIIVSIVAEPETTKTASGLSMPNPNVQDKVEKAVVVSSDNPKIKEGENLLINLGSGKEFTCPTDSKRYRVIAPNEIIVIYE
jgi:co-chaperonin GroES (HSP10)